MALHRDMSEYAAVTSEEGQRRATDGGSYHGLERGGVCIWGRGLGSRRPRSDDAGR